LDHWAAQAVLTGWERKTHYQHPMQGQLAVSTGQVNVLDTVHVKGVYVGPGKD